MTAENKLATSKVCALQHWALYGNPSTSSPTERVLPTDYSDCKPMSKPVAAQWEFYVPASSMPGLINGFSPSEMEEKWFVCSEDYPSTPEQNAKGEGDKLVVNMYRSWTGHQIYELTIELLAPGWKMQMKDAEGVLGEELDIGGKVTGLVWESDEELIRWQDEKSSKNGCREVCRWVLGAVLPEDQGGGD